LQTALQTQLSPVIGAAIRSPVFVENKLDLWDFGHGDIAAMSQKGPVQAS
jgi:hypothetical protein